MLQDTKTRPAPDDFMTEVTLARRYGRSIRTLQRWRNTGTGPAWMRIGGRIFYRLDDVSAFEARARRNQPQ
jgi:hypothetical protein